jgi:probable glucitol transport protein GutA
MTTNKETEKTEGGMNSKASGKLSLRSKICYGLCDTGGGMVWNFIASYLMIFYTDVFKIAPAAVSTLFLVSRLWDAINDPMIGALADRTHSRFGRYRIWMLCGTVPLAVTAILCFWAHPEWSETAKIIYAYVTYCLVVLAYTAINIPFTALAAVMTQDPQERSSLAGFRMGLALAGAITAGQLGARLVPALSKNGDSARGYLLTIIIICCIMIPLVLLSVFNTKEVLQPERAKTKIPIRDQLKDVWRNKPLVLVILVHFIVGLTIYGRMAAVPYFFTYNIGDPTAAGTFFIFMQIPMMIGSFVSPYFCNKLQSKGKVLSFSFILYGIGTVLNGFLSLDNPFVFWGLLGISNFIYGLGYAASYAVIPDTIEYGELHFGTRNDGFVSSMTSFWNKVGMAIGTSATAGILSYLSYNPNGEQTAATLNAIRNITFLIPGIAAVLTGLIFFAYKLDYKEFNHILAELQAKKSE